MSIPEPVGLRPAALRLACLGCTLLLALVLAGCELALPQTQPTETATEETATPAPEATDALEPGVTPLVFWEPYALDRPQGLLLAEMVRDFQTENPDVAVELVPWSGYTGIHDALLAAIPTGELPDLAATFPSMIAEYAAAGVVVSLDPFLTDGELGFTPEERADLFAGSLDAGRQIGSSRQLLAFPFAQNAIGMWVNDSLLSDAGWNRTPATWAEFEQACAEVWAATGTRCYPFVESATTFTAWLYSRGGQVLDASGRQAAFNGPAGVDSLALLRRLIDAGLAWRPEEPYGDYEAFANGQAVFTFSSTGNSPLYLDAMRAAQRNGLPAFRWHQALIPQSSAERQATVLYGSSFVILSTDASRQRAAWRLIRWFSAPVQTARWASGLEVMPVRLSALDVMTDTLAAHPFVETQVKSIFRYARPEPANLASFQVRDVLYTAILSVTQGYADPQTALNQAASQANAALSRQP